MNQADLFLAYQRTVKDGKWYIRIESKNTDQGQRHVHLFRKKLNGKYSWNIDGTRHDEHRFPENEKWIKSAKRMAAKHLGVKESNLQFLTMERIKNVRFIEFESDGIVFHVHPATLPESLTKTLIIVFITCGDKLHMSIGWDELLM